MVVAFSAIIFPLTLFSFIYFEVATSSVTTYTLTSTTFSDSNFTNLILTEGVIIHLIAHYINTIAIKRPSKVVQSYCSITNLLIQRLIYVSELKSTNLFLVML